MSEWQGEWQEKNAFFGSVMTLDPNDYPMEVFLDENGNIKSPLTILSYADCTLDRWYMPDCVPGIRSQVDISQVDDYESLLQRFRIITVLFANDKYIHLAPDEIFFIEPDDYRYKTVEKHFVRRGIEHIQDKRFAPGHLPFEGQIHVTSDKTWVFSNNAWILTEDRSNNGRTGQKVGTPGIKSHRRQYSNAAKIVWGPDTADWSFIRQTTKTKNKSGGSV